MAITLVGGAHDGHVIKNPPSVMRNREPIWMTRIVGDGTIFLSNDLGYHQKYVYRDDDTYVFETGSQTRE